MPAIATRRAAIPPASIDTTQRALRARIAGMARSHSRTIQCLRAGPVGTCCSHGARSGCLVYEPGRRCVRGIDGRLPARGAGVTRRERGRGGALWMARVGGRNPRSDHRTFSCAAGVDRSVARPCHRPRFVRGRRRGSRGIPGLRRRLRSRCSSFCCTCRCAGQIPCGSLPVGALRPGGAGRTRGLRRWVVHRHRRRTLLFLPARWPDRSFRHTRVD